MMKSRNVAIACVLSTVTGLWLPSAWLPERAGSTRRPGPPPAEVRIAGNTRGPALADEIQAAGSFMAGLQAVVAGVDARGPGLADPGFTNWPDLNCDEAEELAQRLAGEAMAASAADGKALLDAIRRAPAPVRQAASAAWAERDPDAFLATLFSREGESLSISREVLVSVISRSPDQIFDRLKSTPHHPSLDRVWAALAEASISLGPEKLNAVLTAAPDDSRSDVIDNVLSTMAQRDGDAALNWAETLPASWGANDRLETVYREWGRKDPEAALRRMFADGYASFTGDGVTGNLAAAWLKADEAGFLQWAGKHGAEGASIVSGAASDLATTDPRRALDLLAKAEALKTAVRENPARGPADAAATESAQQSMRSLYWTIGNAWIASEPAAALAWARALPASDSQFVLSGMVPELIRTLAPDQRRTLAAEIGADTNPGFHLLWNTDREAAVSLLENMPAATALRRVQSVMNDLPAESPSGAAALAASVAARTNDLPDSMDRELGRVLMSSTAAHWSRVDPAAAAAWAASLPDNAPGTTDAAGNVALTWGRCDPVAAQAWAATLTGNTRNAAVSQLRKLGVKVPD